VVIGAAHALALRVARLRDRPRFWTAACLVALGLAVALATSVGAASIPLVELPRALASADHPAHRILWTIRVPRIVAGALVGAALAVAGTLMQAVVRNPLADPGLLGVTAGAGLGGLLAIVLAPAAPWLVPVAALGGGLAAVAGLLAVAQGVRRVRGALALVLTGVAIQAILFALIALVTFTFADRAPAFVAFSVGSLNGAGWSAVRLAALPLAIGVVATLVCCRSLDLLLLDDDSADGVGLGVARARLVAAGLAALLAAGSASVAGLTGFVGLVVPNWARTLVGPAHAVVLPVALVGGATLLVLADTAARVVAAPLELPVGALLALVGGPHFLVTLWRRVA
jgi:iron complex transport system permease protein